MASPTLTLDVEVHNDTALQGAALEHDPYLAVWGSWGAYHTTACHALPASVAGVRRLTIGPYELPALATLRGDETLWLKQCVLTNKSGIAAIDIKEEKHVDRTGQAGILSLPVALLLRAATRNEALAGTEIDPLLRDDLLMKAHVAAANAGTEFDVMAAFETATLRANKGTVSVRVHADAGNIKPHLERFNAVLQRQNDPDTPLLYGTERMLKHEFRVRDAIMTDYSVGFFASADGGAPAWPIGKETSLDNLHLVSYQSEQGWLPAAYYPCTDADTRPVAPRSDVTQYVSTHYGPTRESARFMEDQLAASLRRNGMAHGAFLAAISGQHARATSDATVDPHYLRAIAVVLGTGTFVANTCNYTSDMRYPNKQAVAPPHAALRSRVLRKRLVGDYAALCMRHGIPLAGGAAGADADGIEDFGTGIQCGYSNSDDCEGDSTLASNVVRDMPRVARCDTSLPLLAAAASVVARNVIFDVGASVTGRYLDAKGEEMSHKDVTTLPMIGDAMDARSEIGGHCHGLMLPLPVVAAMLQRGGHDLDKDAPVLARALKAAAAWEFAQAVPITEGTGGTSPFILGEAETYHNDPATLARLAAMRAVHKQVRDSAPTLADAFKMEGMAFNAAKQPAEQRPSSFYRGIAFVMSPQTLALNPLLGTLAIVNVASRTRGAEIGTLLRDCGKPNGGASGLALVSPYKNMGRARWDQEVTPLAACILNQMPLSTVARFRALPPAGTMPMRATFAEAMGRLNHVLSDRVMLALTRPMPRADLTLAEVLDRHARGMAALPPALVPATAATAAGTEDNPVVALFSQPWRLADPDVMARVHTEIQALEKSGHVLTHRFVHNRPLAQCVDTIELHLVLPKPA